MLADDHSHHDHTANLVASPSVASEAVYPSSQGQAAAVDPNLYYNNYQQVHTQTTIIYSIYNICLQVDPYNGGYYDYDTADTGFLGQDNEDRCAGEISGGDHVSPCHIMSRH